jgi:hypothetical protein
MRHSPDGLPGLPQDRGRRHTSIAINIHLERPDRTHGCQLDVLKPSLKACATQGPAAALPGTSGREPGRGRGSDDGHDGFVVLVSVSARDQNGPVIASSLSKDFR